MRATTAATTEHLIRYGGEFTDLVIERADGSWLTAEDGRRILDFTSGQMCATLGHGHPALLDAMQEAAGRVVHLFSGFLSRDVIELARELMAALPAPLARAMFLSTGGEANEAALRLAKLHTGGHEVLAFSGSWHGLTAGAGSSTYSAGRRGYGPGLPGTMALPAPTPYRCPIRHCRDRCDLACLDVGLALADAQSVGAPAAVIAEPILSVAGVVPLPDGYLARLKAACEDRGMLLILDEAQTGLGRVGTMFAFEHDGVVPDVLTLSKTLGGGPAAVGHRRPPRRSRLDVVEKGFLPRHLPPVRPAARRGRSRGAAHGPRRGSRRPSGRARRPSARRPPTSSRAGTRRSATCAAAGSSWAWTSSRTATRATPDAVHGTAVTARCMELGLNVNIVKFPGLGSVLRIAPPLTIAPEEIDLGLEILDRAFADVRG